MDKKIQTHGLTHQEMKELHEKQIHGQVEMIPANNLDTLKDPYFKEEYGDYKIKEHNKNVYHVAMERREFKTVGGMPRKTSTSSVVKFTKEDFEAATSKQSRTFSGYTTHILHYPANMVGAKKEVAPVKPEGDANETGEIEITLEGIKALTSAKEAKDLYFQVTGEEATKNWTLEKTQQEIIQFLGLEEPPKE